MINLLKSLFISAYAPYSVIVAIIAAQQLLLGFDAGWLGVLLIHAPIGLFFVRVLLLRDTARSHPLLPVVSLTGLAGVVSIVIATSRGGSLLPPVLGAVGAATYVLYLFWYSRFGRTPAGALRVGDPLPHFVARDIGGAVFDTADLAGSPAVLLFYRGNWCPLCMAQIREIAADYRRLADRNIRVVLISPQSQARSAKLAAQFDAPMQFVVDENNRIARQLGIAWRHALPAGMQLLGYASESVLPTAIVIDGEGRIVLADQTDNYRIRPEPGTYIAALESA